MRKFVTTSIFLLLTVLVFGQQSEKAITYFDYGKYELTEQSKAILDNLLDKVKSKEIVQIEVIGHTDSDGSDSDNLKLSQDRAASVRQYMVSKGISNENIKSEFFGEAKPAATNENEAGKQKNRRVEIVIYYKDKVEIVQIQKPEIKEDLVIENIVSKVPQQPFTVNHEYLQTFKVAAAKKIVIKGEKGTIIRIPENIFVDTNGAIVTGEITIELLEIYTRSDMILNNIQTTSDSELLETRGMIYIRASSSNMQLSLRKNAFYTIEFPTKDKQNDMNIFYGDTTNHDINWKQAKDNFRSDITYLDDRNELSKYIFNSTELGWINCDRFLNQTATTDLIVNTSDTLEVNFCLVFKSIKSVMNVSDRKGVIKFYNVPLGQTATLIAFKRTSSEIFYSSETITIQENQMVTIELEKLSDKEFKNKLKQFD
jgi:hypothetical protein